jgi:hypothetical protein
LNKLKEITDSVKESQTKAAGNANVAALSHADELDKFVRTNLQTYLASIALSAEITNHIMYLDIYGGVSEKKRFKRKDVKSAEKEKPPEPEEQSAPQFSEQVADQDIIHKAVALRESVTEMRVKEYLSSLDTNKFPLVP